MSEVRKIIKKYYLRQIVACFLVSILLFNTAIVLALEQSNLTGASGLMGATWGNHTVLNTANNAILDWSSFDTMSTQSVTFNQYINGALNSNSAVLNRISSGNVPTMFNGALYANGRVFIVNPAGVLFGASARVNVAQLVASSLNISNLNFIEGKYEFSGGGGAVINKGEIIADSMAALIGKKVLNTGTITCPQGLVVMAAGDRVLLGQPGSDVVVEVVSVTASDILGDALSDGDVINEGTVDAAGGEIVLAAGDTFSRAIDGLEGISVAVESGTGRVGQFGTLNADGIDGDGGSITLTAGGVVALGPDSVTTANAGTNGDGGDIIAYSPGLAIFRDGAYVQAKGGTESGNGGFFELSGKKHTEIFGDIDMTASNGKAGSFFIDPYNIWINDFGIEEGSVSSGKWTANFEVLEYVGPLDGSYYDSYLDIDDLTAYLNSANVTVSTEGPGSGTGWILLDTFGYSGSMDAWGSGRDLDYGGSNELTLLADDFIMINSVIDFGGSGNLKLDAGTGDLLINSPITMGGGDLLLDAGQDVVLADGKSLTGLGDFSAEAGHDIILGGEVEVAGDMTLLADKDNINGEMLAKSSLTTTGTAGNGDIYIEGEIIQTDGPVDSAGKIEMQAVKSYSDPLTGKDVGIYLNDWVQAVGDIILRGVSGDEWGGVVAYDFLTSLSGKIDILTDYYIALHGAVNAYTDLIMKAETGYWDDGYITADSTLTAQTGNLEALAEESVTFNDVASAGSDMTLNADSDGDGAGNLNVNGLVAGGTIDMSAGDDTINIHKSADPMATYDVDAGDNINLNNNTVADAGVKLDAGQDIILADGKTLDGLGDFSAEAGHDIILGGEVEAAGDMTLLADKDNINGEMLAKSSLTTTGTAGNGDIYIEGEIIQTDGPVDSAGKIEMQAVKSYSDPSTSKDVGIYLNDWVQAVGDIILRGISGDDWGRVEVQDSLTALNGKIDILTDWYVLLKGAVNAYTDLIMKAEAVSYGDSYITADSTLTAQTGNLEALAEESVTFNDVAIAGSDMTLNADLDGDSAGNLNVNGLVAGGTIDMSAGDDTINIHKSADPMATYDVDAGVDIKLNNNTVADAGVKLGAGQDVILADGKSLDGLGYFTVKAGGDIILGGDVTTAGDMLLDADEDVVAKANLESTGGDIEIYSSDSTTYIGGDYVKAFGNILFNNDTEFTSWDDQLVHAINGIIIANGYLLKINSETYCGFTYWSNGSLYLRALGDIILGDSVGNDFVQAALNCFIGGGVSVISDTGKVYTAGYGSDDTLNVPVIGRSTHVIYKDVPLSIVGVDLPYGPGKAAIVVLSSEDLLLGPGAALSAYGKYDTSGLVDDRVGVGFLDAAVHIPPGGPFRNPGSAFDAAIYLGSATGNVDVSSPVSILSQEEFIPDNGLPNGNFYPYICIPKGTMIVDAYDTVTFGDSGFDTLFEDSLLAGNVGSRLEVCSRITEWLNEAVAFGRLPYAGSAAFMSLLWYGNPSSYILRGAGLDNPEIDDGRAWVLENRIPPPPYNQMQLLGIDQQVPEVSGCPAVMAAAALELGIEEGNIEVVMADAMAVASDIQPCDTCARLVDAAAILRDEEGARMAALAEVINLVAPADVPYTPEVGILIAAAFEGRAGDGTAYATALEYIDAFVAYVSILNLEMDSPVGDSVVFIMGKYGEGISTNPNSNIAAYVRSRLEAIGG